MPHAWLDEIGGTSTPDLVTIDRAVLFSFGDHDSGVVDVETAETMGFLEFSGAVEELFDVQVLVHATWPEVLEPGDRRASNSFLLADEHLAHVSMPVVPDDATGVT